MIDVVVCGNLRGEIAAYQVLRQLILARDNGLVDGIVLSTWHSELDRFPDLARTLNAQGVIVVSQAPPEPFAGTIVYQHVQFLRGLQALPISTRWILKTRTDKAFGHTTALLADLANSQLQLEFLHQPSEVFDCQIIVPGVSISETLAHNDLAILGRREDLMRCISSDLAFDYAFNDQGYFPQEARWFAAPILTRWPYFKDLFAAVSLPRLSASIKQAACDHTLANAPESVFQYLGLTLSLTRDLFGVFDTRDYGLPAHIEDYFSFRSLRPQAINWGDRLIATSQSWLSAMEFTKDDPVAARLLPYVFDAKSTERQLKHLDVHSLFNFAQADKIKIPPLRYIVSQATGRRSDQAALLRALTRRLSARENTALLARLDAAIDLELEHADHRVLLQTARELDAEARITGDRDKAFAAYSAYMCGAWGRLEEAMDGACGLALDGLIDEEYKSEALETVYPIYAQDESRPCAKFWHGYSHIHSAPSTNEETGWRLIRAAAEEGFERAQLFLAMR